MKDEQYNAYMKSDFIVLMHYSIIVAQWCLLLIFICANIFYVLLHFHVCRLNVWAHSLCASP